MNTCLVTFLYPKSRVFFKNFISDVQKQKFKNFDIVCACDSFRPKIQINKKINYIYFEKTHISEIRRLTIKKIIKMGYKKIIFTDVDDRFDINKLEVYSTLLNNNSIVFNEINIKKKDKISVINYFSNFFKKNTSINYQHILENNFLGFTNTGIRADAFKKNINFLNNSFYFAYDWFFYSNLLIYNKAFFTKETVTEYNCCRNSLTNLPPRVSKDYIDSCIEIKKNLYMALNNKKKVYEMLYKKILAFETCYKKKPSLKVKKKLKGWWDL